MISLAIAFSIHQTVLKDIHIVAAPLEKVVSQLGSIFHSSMDVSILLQTKIVLIDATQVSESEVRDQIAKTTNATWEKKGETWHLTKTAKQQREDEDKAAGMRARFLRKTLEIRQKALKEKPELTSTSAAQMYHQLNSEEEQAQKNHDQMGRPGPSPAGYGLPNQRFMSRFLLKFGFDRIAAVPNGHRAVFCMSPNAMQSKMGIDLSDVVAKYRSEQAIWIKAVTPLETDKEGKASSNGERTMYARSSDSFGYGLESSFGSMPPELKDILFTVYCSQDGGYQFRLVGIPQGDAPNIMYDIKATSYEGAFAGMEGSDFETKPVEGFKLSQESEDFKNFRENQIAKISESRRATVIEKLADPVKRDPLSYALTESLVFDMRRYNHNIVAVVGDSQVNIAEPMFADLVFKPKFSEIIQDFFAKDDKWVRMTEAPFSEPNIPRSELKRLIANVRANKKVSLWDRAAIASFRPRTNTYSYIECMLDSFAGTVHEGYNDADALKLIGLMSESERLAATGPNGIPFSQLNTPARQHLFECCYYNQDNRIWFVTPNKRPQSNAIATEPTYLSPTGIPGTATLKITERNLEKIKEPDGQGSQNIANDANGWGQILYQVDHPEEFPGNPLKFDKTRKLFRIKITQYDFKLRMNADCEWQSSLTNADRIDNTTFTVGSLPDDMQADFDGGYKQMAEGSKARKELLKIKGGGGGTTRQNAL
ncbi:MAG: hypothetical protein WCG75_02810 [Armatimonadota bacterium]